MEIRSILKRSKSKEKDKNELTGKITNVVEIKVDKDDIEVGQDQIDSQGTKAQADIGDIEAGQDQIDSQGTKAQVKKYKIKSVNLWMSVWILIEMSILAIDLFLKTGEGYPNNFNKEVFSIQKDTNDIGTLTRMIALRLLTGFLFLLGTTMVRMNFSKWLNRILFSIKSFFITFSLFLGNSCINNTMVYCYHIGICTILANDHLVLYRM